MTQETEPKIDAERLSEPRVSSEAYRVKPRTGFPQGPIGYTLRQDSLLARSKQTVSKLIRV